MTLLKCNLWPHYDKRQPYDAQGHQSCKNSKRLLLLANVEKIWGGGKQIWATCVFPWTQGMGGMLRGPVCQVLLPSGNSSCSKTSKPTSRINLCTLMRCVWLMYEWWLTLSSSPFYSWRTSVLYLPICIQEVWCRGVVYRCKFKKGQFQGSHQRDRSLPFASCLWTHTLWTLKRFHFNLPRSSHPSPTSNAQVGTHFFIFNT